MPRSEFRDFTMLVLAIAISIALSSGCSRDDNIETQSVAKSKQSAGPAGSLKAADTPIDKTVDAKEDEHALHNLMQVCEGVYSGGQPDSDEAFADLEKMGVKTIVSVDGAKPDVVSAKKHGLQYVHIPLGYDGVPQPAALAIVRVMKERPGPVYFHCHHGKHRGPAAAAVAGRCSGKMGVLQAIEYLDRAGTGKEYKGLWQDVVHFQMPAADATFPDLVETAEVESLAAAMANIDRIYDRLKLCEQSKWTTPAGHADVSPTQEALLLKEAFRESARHLPDAKQDALQAGLASAEKLAELLESSLQQKKPDEATATFAKLTAACKACHAAHRN